MSSGKIGSALDSLLSLLEATAHDGAIQLDRRDLAGAVDAAVMSSIQPRDDEGDLGSRDHGVTRLVIRGRLVSLLSGGGEGGDEVEDFGKGVEVEQHDPIIPSR